MSTTPPASRPRRESGSDRSAATLVKDVLSGSQTLVRKELELAKLELTAMAGELGKAAGAGGAAGVLALYLLGFLGLAGGYGLAEVVPTWAAFLIIAAVFALLALGAVLFARAKANKAQSYKPDQTTTRLKEDFSWAKQLKRP
jgi:hypothetical protein